MGAEVEDQNLPAAGRAAPKGATDSVPSVKLSVAWPLEKVTVDGLEIGLEPVEVDAETAQRAHEAAGRSGYTLKEGA
jgi:hypothetical protein